MAFIQDFIPANTDYIDRKADDATNIFSASDLTFPLASGVYKLEANVTISVPITTEVGSSVYIISDGGRTLTLDGTGDLITGNATGGVLVLDNFNISITGASATLFNTTNMIVGCEKINFLFTASSSQTIGSLINSPLSVSFEGCIFNAWANGLTVDNQATRTFIDTCQFSSDLSGTGDAITIGANCPRSEILLTTFTLADGESLFNINSSFTGRAVIQNYTNNNQNSTVYNAAGLDNSSVYVRNDESSTVSYINALNQAGVQTALTQNKAKRINATYTVRRNERIEAAVNGDNKYIGLNPSILGINGSIVGTVSTGVNITINLFLAKGNTGNTITTFADAGGGQVTVTTSSDHGYSNSDRIIIEDTANYDNEYTISNVTATTFEITATFVATETGSHYKLLEETKINNDFSGSDKNTTIVSQISVVTNDVYFLCVENIDNAGLWNTSDIQLVSFKS